MIKNHKLSGYEDKEIRAKGRKIAARVEDNLKRGKSLPIIQDIITDANRTSARFISDVSIRESEKPVCKVECAYCCYLPVEPSPAEIINIVSHLRANLTDEEFNAEKTRMLTMIDQRSGIDKYTTNVPCPLLKDSKCSVYSVRPMTCRSFNSLNVSDCEDMYNNPAGNGEMVSNKAQMLVYSMASLTLIDGLNGKYGLEPRVVEIDRGLKVALESKDSGASWLDGNKVF